MNRFYMSQTMLKIYESGCPIAFSKQFFGTDGERYLFDMDKEVFKRGVLFETLAIGAGLSGKQAKEGDVPRTSVYYSRIVEQAKIYREWEHEFASKAIGLQMYLKAKIEWDGGTYYAQGNLDRVVRDKDGKIAIIDTKLTGDKDNTYGKFQFGNPRKVDWTQLIHYRLIAKANFKEDVRQMFYVADSKPEMGVKVLEPEILDYHEWQHHDRCQRVYDEINTSLQIGYWEPKPSANNCGNCPLGDEQKMKDLGMEPCKFKRRTPEIELITLD